MMTKSRLVIIEVAPKSKFKIYLRRPCLQNDTQDMIKTWISFNNHDLIKKSLYKAFQVKNQIHYTFCPLDFLPLVHFSP